MSRRIFSIAKNVVRSLSNGKMTNFSAHLEAVPIVEIDEEGVFKYVLIKVYDCKNKANTDGIESEKLIVR